MIDQWDDPYLNEYGYDYREDSEYAVEVTVTLRVRVWARSEAEAIERAELRQDICAYAVVQSDTYSVVVKKL